MIRRCLLILIAAVLASCQPGDGTYLLRGPGYDLDTKRASGESGRLYQYLRVMCVDAGLALASEEYPEGCPNGLSGVQYQTLLQAGFNEINSGCKAYVQFVFEERVREHRFKSSNSAIQAFINGLLTIEGAGAKLFSYLVLTSTAANAFYDASRIDPLQGMTVETIVKVVNERQIAFEKAAANRTVTSRPQLIRVWREYQWLCTPLAINSDFNALTAASVDGTRVDFDADARELVDSITTAVVRVRNFDPGKGLQKIPKGPSIDGSLGAFEKALQKQQVMKLQSALCIGRDGGFGPGTRAAIDAWRRAISPRELKDPDLNSGLSTEQGEYLLRAGSCASLGYKSTYERAYLYDTQVFVDGATTASVAAGRAANLAFIAGRLGVTISTGSIRVDGDLRTAIRKKREELKLPKGDYIDKEFLTKL